MAKDNYTVPNEEWLKEEFKDIPFGVMRPSEMELILSYFLVYHDGNLGMQVEDLAKKYKITEAKAKRLKIEFAERYRDRSKVTPKEDIAGIIARLIDGGKTPFEYSPETKTVNFIVRDPWELKKVKQDLLDKLIVYKGDFEGRLIKLSLANFICFMGQHYENIQKNAALKALVAAKFNEAKLKDKELWKSLPLDEKAKKSVEKYAPIAGAIFSLVTGIKG
jgi:hypothetical protein